MFGRIGFLPHQLAGKLKGKIQQIINNLSWNQWPAIRICWSECIWFEIRPSSTKNKRKLLFYESCNFSDSFAIKVKVKPLRTCDFWVWPLGVNAFVTHERTKLFSMILLENVLQTWLMHVTNQLLVLIRFIIKRKNKRHFCARVYLQVLFVKSLFDPYPPDSVLLVDDRFISIKETSPNYPFWSCEISSILVLPYRDMKCI